MRLSEYLHKLATDKETVIDDRVLYLYDTTNNVYFSKVIHPAHIDQDGTIYLFFDSDEPFHDFDRVNVIRAWTVNNMINCMMGLDSLLDNYGESEV